MQILPEIRCNALNQLWGQHQCFYSTSTRIKFLVQYAKPWIFITGFNFFMQTLTKQQINKKRRRKKPKKGWTKMAIICQTICCVVIELYPAMSMCVIQHKMVKTANLTLYIKMPSHTAVW